MVEEFHSYTTHSDFELLFPMTCFLLSHTTSLSLFPSPPRPLAQHQHQTSVDSSRGLGEDQIPEEENSQKNLPMKYSEQTKTSSSSSSSSSSSLQDFSFSDGGDTASGNSAKAVEMAPAGEIFFHGHLLPLHLLSHFSPLPSPRLSVDGSDSFALPIEEYSPDGDQSTSTRGSSMASSIKSSFKGRCGNRIHSETTPHHVSPSKSKPLSSLFRLSRRRRADESRGYDGDKDDRQRRKFRFVPMSRAVKRYVRSMATSLLHFRRRNREEEEDDIELQFRTLTPGDLGRTGMFSAPASVTASPRNSSLLVKRPVFSDTVTDSTVEELQAAIQAAIAYCKKSIADG